MNKSPLISIFTHLRRKNYVGSHILSGSPWSSTCPLGFGKDNVRIFIVVFLSYETWIQSLELFEIIINSQAGLFFLESSLILFSRTLAFFRKNWNFMKKKKIHEMVAPQTDGIRIKIRLTIH